MLCVALSACLSQSYLEYQVLYSRSYIVFQDGVELYGLIDCDFIFLSCCVWNVLVSFLCAVCGTTEVHDTLKNVIVGVALLSVCYGGVGLIVC